WMKRVSLPLRQAPQSSLLTASILFPTTRFVTLRLQSRDTKSRCVWIPYRRAARPEITGAKFTPLSTISPGVVSRFLIRSIFAAEP
ncbi:hypothetical protein AVDCRST_MAG81-2957, partial [uncultured Synechococcales cyanobacterium]